MTEPTRHASTDGQPPSRRRFLIAGSTGLATISAFDTASGSRAYGTTRPAEPEREAGGQLTPAHVLRRLAQGNARWVSGHLAHPHQSVARREAVAAEQHPLATVFSCIDSRLPPEIVFDQGVGDLFVVRTAAQTNDGLVQGAVEYGVDEAITPLLVVMGHQRCGAVTFAVETLNAGRKAPAHLADVVTALRPAYEAAKSLPGDQVDNTVRAQTRLTVRQLRHDTMLEPLEARGRARIVGAYYSLATGHVEFLRG